MALGRPIQKIRVCGGSFVYQRNSTCSLLLWVSKRSNGISSGVQVYIPSWSRLSKAVLRILDVMKAFLMEVIRVGITLPRKVHEGLPGNTLSGSEFSAIDTSSLNGTQISCRIRYSKVCTSTEMIMMVITASPLATVMLITVILPSL